MDADTRNRLEHERDVLFDNLEKLTHFICGNKFRELSSENQFLLCAQAGVMRTFGEILQRRLEIN